MAILEVYAYPDDRLRNPAAEVTEFDESLGQLVDDLFETLYVTNSIGLCAQQTPDQRAVLVIDVSSDKSAPQHFVNPEILSASAPGLVEETCLSVPDYKASVWRKTKLRVRAQNRTGDTFEKDLSGMEAVCLQHEMDHLQGKLFVDRLSWWRRWRFRQKRAA